MANTQSVLRTVVKTNETPGQVLRQTNEVLCTHIPRNMFVTCFYGILIPEAVASPSPTPATPPQSASTAVALPTFGRRGCPWG